MWKTGSEIKGYALRSSKTEKSVMEKSENTSDKNMSVSDTQLEQDIVEVDREQTTVQQNNEQNTAQKK